MEKRVKKSFFLSQAGKEKSSSSNDENYSVGNKAKNQDKKEVNSWDRSTSTSNGKISKRKTTDWESNSICQETMVEPFDNNEIPKDCDNWDSECDSDKEENIAVCDKVTPPSFNTDDSFELSLGNFSNIDKSSSEDLMGSGREKPQEEDCLFVEDFDEFLKDDNDPKSKKEEGLIQSPGSNELGTCNEKVWSKQSEGTPEDTTIWMIPKSERTQSGESTSKLISSSDKVKIEKLNQFKKVFKKSKSLSDVEKSKIRRSARSEYLGSQKNNYNSFLLCEGSELQRKLEIANRKENVAGCESFDRTRVFFTEYECRAMTIDKDTPEKLVASSTSELTGAEEVLPDFIYEVSQENPSQSPHDRIENAVEEEFSEIVRPGPSGFSPLDVISLPDMTGKNSIKERQKEKNGSHLNLDGEGSESAPQGEPSKASQMTESWLLLDDTGHYQAVTRNEVSILLNGRSAEAVLQGRKQHFISTLSLKDTASLKDSLSCVVANESLSFLKEEDIGGEDYRKNLLDLERKIENTLFYIQPGMNLTASIRIIPLETEMIHLWKRTRDGGSVLSSEVDLLNPSQDSVEAVNQRNPAELQTSIINLPRAELMVEGKEESQSPNPSMASGPLDFTFSAVQVNESSEYRKLLFETRKIVDSLTNNFQTLQNRLEGETNRSLALQIEVNKLRVLLKKCGGKSQDINSGETAFDTFINLNPSMSTPALEGIVKTQIKSGGSAEDVTEEYEDAEKNPIFDVQDKKSAVVNVKSLTSQKDSNELNGREENDVITVNIYTVESVSPIPSIGGKPQEMYSIVHSNLKMIENKMKRLQQENDCMLKQNVELKKKLKEISMELEKYLSGTSEQDIYSEEGRESETPRDQVCNLKLELENLKTLMRDQRQQLKEENSLMNEEFTKSLFSLKDWCTMANEVFQKLLTVQSKLQQNGIAINVSLEPSLFEDPKSFSIVLLCYIEQTTQCLITIKNENFLLEQSLKEDIQRQSSKEISGLDQVISGYSQLIDQCRKGHINGDETKVMEDYFAVIMEKASLVEEVKILKTENEMLLESQLQHYEKLKQTMIALKERKSEISALESTQKLSEEERHKMSEVLKLYEEEKMKMEKEITEKSRTIDNLMEERTRKDIEFNDRNERLEMAMKELKNFEKLIQIKDELINKLKIENHDLLTGDQYKNNQIEILNDELKNLEIQRTQLEAEYVSSKNSINESHKEMKDYITHLEALINDSQDSIDKMKQRLKENSQIINRLKSENDVLEKQHQCDLKLLNNTKDEMDSCKEKLTRATSSLKESEGEREKLQKKYEVLAGSEKEKSDSLEILGKEFKVIFDENAQLKEKVELFSKVKDETLKEQKDLINKYSMLSKEIQKLQEKYRSVKSECNQRTDLIKYLEIMLKENLVEYNSRISCLEQNISRILEKIAACKNGMREKHFGVDTEIRDLRQQLDVTCQERREMEKIVNNYHSLVKRLESEIQQREDKVDELNVKLSLEQQKALEYENERRSFHRPEPKNSEALKIEQLESHIATTESELAECKRELQLCQTNYENEKKKLELSIADLKSEIKRYQLRFEVIMKNLSNCNRNMNSLPADKRNADESEVQTLKKELQEKSKLIAELNGVIHNLKAEIKLKDSNLENFNKKSFYHDEELKNLQNQIAKMRECTNVLQQKEKDEMSEKLCQSIKLIMEERSARQALESILTEKERHFKDQIDKTKNELSRKVKECEEMSRALEDKKKSVNKLQDDLKKTKAEVVSLRRQADNLKRKCQQGNGDNSRIEEDHSIAGVKAQNASPVRLESYLRELKDVREMNLQLRKTEGQYQAKIVLLEDEIRSSKLLIKELEGDIKTEKKSKKALKSMILAAKMEIEKCLVAKQLMSVVADKISRHLDLTESSSRELLSGFRLNNL